jgi:uncharacterized protein
VGLQSMIRVLLPREDQFFDLMERQAKVLHEGAVALSRFDGVKVTADDVQKHVQEVEHKGDALLFEIEEALAKTFVTPIDREDIQALSTKLDDILDIVNLTARSFKLYAVPKPSTEMRAMMDILVKATSHIETALPALRKNSFDGIRACIHDVRALEKEGDTVFRDAVAKLFRDDAVDAKSLLRDKEVLEDLESAIDACEDLTDMLHHLAVKHG